MFITLFEAVVLVMNSLVLVNIYYRSSSNFIGDILVSNRF